MDATAFDRLVRSFAANETRRRLVTALAILPVSGIMADRDAGVAEAETPRERIKRRKDAQRRRRRRRKHHGANGGGNGGGGNGGKQPGSCAPNGGACQQDSDCCRGNCFGQICAAPPDQCDSVNCPADATGCCPADGCCLPPANQCNPAGLCCAPNCADRQCGTDGCGNSGVCGSCQNGQTCNANGQCVGQATCSPQTCPDGCCDEDNTCHSPANASFCGIRGAACVTCLPEQVCNPTTGVCSNDPGCNENTCDGCCTTAGQCVGGDTPAACGEGGVKCDVCEGSAATCEDGLCACTPDCALKVCGDDGCGGTCGACDGPCHTCIDGGAICTQSCDRGAGCMDPCPGSSGCPERGPDPFVCCVAELGLDAGGACQSDAPCCYPAVCGTQAPSFQACCIPNGLIPPERNALFCCSHAMSEDDRCCEAGIIGCI